MPVSLRLKQPCKDLGERVLEQCNHIIQHLHILLALRGAGIIRHNALELGAINEVPERRLGLIEAKRPKFWVFGL